MQPYYEARDLLEPNLGGGFWNVPSADCYAGISARWYIDLWGDHNREGSLAALLAVADFNRQEMRVHARLPLFLRTYGVTHMVSPFPLSATTVMPFAGRAGQAYVYRVEGTARVRFVSAARVVSDDKEAVPILLAADFDPNREIVLHDAPADLGAARASAAPGTGRAEITGEDQRGLTVRVTAPADGFLLVADTFYPGWTVSIDGRAAPLYRANIAVRGVPVPAGTHDVRFAYEPPGLAQGARISAVAFGLLLVWTAGAAYSARRRAR